MKISNKITEQEKQNTRNFYNKMYIETLERLSKNVAEGEVTPRRTAEQIIELTSALRELNGL